MRPWSLPVFAGLVGMLACGIGAEARAANCTVGNSIINYNYSGTITTCTIPTTGEYLLSAVGANGGASANDPSGDGADVAVDFDLTAGQQLKILVGGAGAPSTNHEDTFSGAGGGGGSFIVLLQGFATPLVVAGGGGGGGPDNGGQGLGLVSTAGSGTVNGGAGGSNGSGGLNGSNTGSSGGGGAGFFGNGAASPTSFSANAFDSGSHPGQGGLTISFTDGETATYGGFGGGGAGCCAGTTGGGGGGGGYSGGGGGGFRVIPIQYGAGGGGTSYVAMNDPEAPIVAGTLSVYLGGVIPPPAYFNGNGAINIQYVGPLGQSVPEPASGLLLVPALLALTAWRRRTRRLFIAAGLGAAAFGLAGSAEAGSCVGTWAAGTDLTCTIPTFGTYEFFVIGADGGSAFNGGPGGVGIQLRALFSTLNAGDQFQLLVGSTGSNGASNTGFGGGGGGGSFILDMGNGPPPATPVPIMVAGGGGGGGVGILGFYKGAGLPALGWEGMGGVTSGGSGYTSLGNYGQGGMFGYGGAASTDGGGGSGGGGVVGNGGATFLGGAGNSVVNGGAGGVGSEPTQSGGSGGFGGGGAGGSQGGGGGGGFSGGGAGGSLSANQAIQGGGGGGGNSFITTRPASAYVDGSLMVGTNTVPGGEGEIQIIEEPAGFPVPEPASGPLLVIALAGIGVAARRGRCAGRA